MPSSAARSNRVLWLGLLLAFGLGALFSVEASAAKVPKGNMVPNPSFESGQRGWMASGARIKVVRDRSAPDGRTFAEVRGRRGTYTIDDAKPAVAPVSAGTAYVGAAWVKGSKRTAGRKVELVLREADAAGTVVGETSSKVKLSQRRFTKVDVRRSAGSDGGTIEVLLRHSSKSKPKAVFFADAISVSVAPPAGAPAEPSPNTGGSHLTTSQIALVTSQEDPLFQSDGSKYRYIVIRDSLGNRIGDLRAVHPEAEILLYKNVGFTSQDSCQWAPLQGTGVDFCLADSHESWFLHRRDNPGQRISSEAYPSYRAMDIGDASYQGAWTSSVLERLRDAKNNGSGAAYDGVFMDDLNLMPGHGMDGRIHELTDDEYLTAAVSFATNVAPQIENAGFKTVSNLAANPWEPAQRSAAVSIARHMSAINREGLVRWGENGALFTTDGEAPFWEDEVEMAERTQAAGADLHAITYGSPGDVRAQRYARATFLMAWDGSDGGALNYRTNDPGRSWLPAWTTDVGVPQGPRKATGSGYLRDFSAGVVVVNPSSSGAQSFALAGSFRNPDGGGCVRSVRLEAATAAVMPAC